MKNSNRGMREAEKPAITVGIDLGDRFSRYCVVNQAGEVMEEGKIATTTAALSDTSPGKQDSGWLWNVGRILVAVARKLAVLALLVAQRTIVSTVPRC